MSPLAVLAIVVASGAAAWIIATLIVVVLDVVGLCYSASAEERRHAAEGAPQLTAAARRRFPQ